VKSKPIASKKSKERKKLHGLDVEKTEGSDEAGRDSKVSNIRKWHWDRILSMNGRILCIIIISPIFLYF